MFCFQRWRCFYATRKYEHVDCCVLTILEWEKMEKQINTSDYDSMTHNVFPAARQTHILSNNSVPITFT